MPVPQENNDYGPVSPDLDCNEVSGKLMIDVIMMWKLNSNINGQLDSYQFAYEDNRGTDFIYLEIPKAYVRMCEFSHSVYIIYKWLYKQSSQHFNVKFSDDTSWDLLIQTLALV